MFQRISRGWLAPLAALATLTVSAQTAPSTPSGTPGYRSAFEGYQAYGEDKPLSWKEANDTVGKVGGWRAYAAEAQRAAEPPAPATGSGPSVTAPAANPHAGHGKP